MNTTTIAKKYIAHGFSPIPLIDGEKRPSIRNWQQYSDEPMGIKEAEQLFQNTNSIGLVMGFDGIQCPDIDAKHFRGEEYEVSCKRLEEEAPGLKEKMIIQTTRSGGYHWIFKCDEIAGNQKFARNIDGEVTFETRDKGGQIVTYPSKGYKILVRHPASQFLTQTTLICGTQKCNSPIRRAKTRGGQVKRNKTRCVSLGGSGLARRYRANTHIFG